MTNEHAVWLQEYAENRSITSVVPVDNPLTTDEPELLEMSPEQAEETQLCALHCQPSCAMEPSMPQATEVRRPMLKCLSVKLT